MPSAETPNRLSNAKEMFKLVEFGLRDVLTGSPDRRIAGVSNVSVFGRAVTNALQRLKDLEPDFGKWYSKYRVEMENDPLMKYMYNLRSTILKEADFSMTRSTHIKSFNSETDMGRLGPIPPFAKSLVFGDRYGGNGWVVRLPDGGEEMYYIAVPSDIATSNLHFPDAPREHLGKSLQDDTIQTVCQAYVSYLMRMIRDAEETFGKKAA